MNTISDSPLCPICMTRQLTNGVWECLAVNSQDCPHALEFGFTHHICRHPEPHSFRNKDNPNKGKPGNSGL